MPISSQRSTPTGPVNDGGGIIILGAIGLAIFFGYEFVTVVLPLAWAQLGTLVVNAAQLSGPLDSFTWSNLAWDALVGFGAGVLIGVLRYVWRLGNGVVLQLVDAIASPDVVSVTRAALGFLWVVWHGLAGAIAGVVLGWLGMIQFPQLLTGEAARLPASPGSAIRLLVANGFFGGAGGGPPPGVDASPFLAILVIAVVTLLATVIGVMALTAILAAFGKAFASGFVAGFFKGIGINLVLVLTRLGRWSWADSRRPIMTDRPPLDLGEEVARFVEEARHSGKEERCLQRIHEYFQWLRDKRMPITPALVVDRLSDFQAEMERRGLRWSAVLPAFQRYLLERRANVDDFTTLDLEKEALAFARLGSTPEEENRRRIIDAYFEWLKREGHSIDISSVMARHLEYAKPLPNAEYTLLVGFVSRLRSELGRRYPRSRSLYGDEAPEALLYPGWLRHALVQALWIGFFTGTVNIIASAVCLLIVRGQLLGGLR